ncbi:MAG: GntG family PLP-dependent aldolase [Acidobacteriota bacterium]
MLSDAAADARPVDLRSDTVTRPDARMRRAMAEAEVGDDVFGEDPTVRRLQDVVAEQLGTEAALFVPSGTMGNQIALHLAAEPGSEVWCADDSHVVLYEMGAMAALSGLQARTVAAPGGLLDAELLRRRLPAPAPYRAPARVLVVENTFNMAGGRVYDRERLDALLAVVAERGLTAHLDGARLWNAAVALGVEPAELTRGFATVSVCLSKGLGAPVGSVLAGSRDAMTEAWRLRKMFGGGMRQVGVLAAAALVALEEGAERLRADHRHARRLAEGLAEIVGLAVDPTAVETNIVLCRVEATFFGETGAADGPGEAHRVVTALADRGVLAIPTAADALRFVTHRDIGAQDIDRALAAMRSLAA